MKRVLLVLTVEINDTLDLIHDTQNRILKEEVKYIETEDYIHKEKIEALKSLKKPMNMIITNYLMLNR